MISRRSLARFPRAWTLEIVVVAAALLVVVVLRWRGARMGWRALELMLPSMVSALPKILIWGLVLNVLATLALRRSVAGYLESFFRVRSLLGWVRVCAAFMLVTFAYTWLKVCVPLLRERVWDAELWQVDRWLHLGYSPNVFAATLFSSPPVLHVLDLWYSFWIVTIFAAWAWAAAQPDVARRRGFVFGCALLSIAGSWLYVALPALGPCYAYPAVFASIRNDIPYAVGTQAALAANYARMVAGRSSVLRQFNPYLGVAAFPSLHVGAHWYFALWARRYERRLFVPLAGATALTFLASLATGWHYAVDGYAGMLLAWLAVRAVDRFEPARLDAEASGNL